MTEGIHLVYTIPSNLMPFLTQSERAFLRAVSNLIYCNPFLPERVKYERQVLGPDFEGSEVVWSMNVEEPQQQRANALRIGERIEMLAGKLAERLQRGVTSKKEDLDLYHDAVLYLL